MVLRANGYPEHVIQAAARPMKATTQEEQLKYTICLLYMAGVGEDLRRVCRKSDICTVFTTISILRQQLTEVDPTLKKSSVVYRIPCSCGLAYIRETKRILETHLKEHQTATR